MFPLELCLLKSPLLLPCTRFQPQLSSLYRYHACFLRLLKVHFLPLYIYIFINDHIWCFIHYCIHYCDTGSYVIIPSRLLFPLGITQCIIRYIFTRYHLFHIYACYIFCQFRVLVSPLLLD